MRSAPAIRRNEDREPGHGARGADLARQLRNDLPPLTDDQFDTLCEACDRHTDGRIHRDPTIGACWDADRLDLWRVGISPTPDLLSTASAREAGTRSWARDRSGCLVVPTFVEDVWMERVHGG